MEQPPDETSMMPHVSELINRGGSPNPNLTPYHTDNYQAETMKSTILTAQSSSQLDECM